MMELQGRSGMNGKIAAGILVTAVMALSAAVVYRHIQNQTLDKPVMQNPNASVQELLTGEWESEDGT